MRGIGRVDKEGGCRPPRRQAAQGRVGGPAYLSNYMYSGMIALAYFSRYSTDSARFVPAYLSLLRGGWPAPAQVLLRRHLGREVEDPALVDQNFTLIERRLEELEGLYRRGRAS